MARNKLTPLSILLTLFLSMSSYSGDITPPKTRYDYSEMFELTRGVMTRKPARDLLNSLFAEQLEVNAKLAEEYGFVGERIKGFTETQMMLLLQEVPSIRKELRAYLAEVPTTSDSTFDSPATLELRKKWREKFTELFQDKKLLVKFFKKNNPLEPFVMELPPGTQGFGSIKSYITHPIRLNGKIRPADNVEKAVVDFIKSAEREIRFNVFDFDLHSIADALVEAHRAGKDVVGGIDSGVIEARPEVRAIYDKLVGAGIPVMPVDSVGLNHQKLIVTDWSTPKARVLMSEGNFTQSCLSPNGDLNGTRFLAPEAIPNANMVNIVDSQTLALVTHHELTKTIDPKYALRGREYPISGAYEILGAPSPLGKPRSLTIAFTPNGGLRDINQNFISRVIKATHGPTYIAQFAFSSAEVEAALLAEAVAEKAAGRKFILKLVGDTPFSMQTWSVFLSIAGYRMQDDGTTKGYVKIPDDENKWLQALGKSDYATLQKNLRIAPEIYGNHFVKTPDGFLKITSKIHHKLMVSGEPGRQVGIFGSFNFSQGAENNQEYIVAIQDEEVNAKLQGIVEWLSERSPRTVGQETQRRNKYRDFVPDLSANEERPVKALLPKKPMTECSELFWAL
jgi:hypothetical protein